MGEIVKLEKLKTLRELRERKALGRLVQARAQETRSKVALKNAKDAHSNTLREIEEQKAEVLTQIAKANDGQSMFAKLMVSRFRDQRRIVKSRDEVSECSAKLAVVVQISDHSRQAHNAALRETERLSELYGRVTEKLQIEEENLEEDAISELFASLMRGK